MVPSGLDGCQASVVAVTDSRSVSVGGGRRRTIRAHRPRRPTGSPCTSVATTSVPGCGGRLRCCPSDRSGPASERSSGAAVGVEPERIQHRRKQGVGRLGVPGRRRVELVVAEQVVAACEQRPEQVAERHRAAAGLHHGDRLGRREIARHPPGQGAQRLARSGGWCPGPGRCRRRPRRRSPAGRVPRRPGSARRPWA